MPPTTIHEMPPDNSFTTLEAYQSQTPRTFHDEKPVLYLTTRVRALVSPQYVSKLPIFEQHEQPEEVTRLAEINGGFHEENVTVLVSSESLIIFNLFLNTGISIPYPGIALHAIKRFPDPNPRYRGLEAQGLYMELDFSDASAVGDDEESDNIELTLIPISLPDPEETVPAAERLQSLFEAVSACSDLHPDPRVDDEESQDRIVFEGNVGYEGVSGLPGVQRGATDGGLPPPMPGSGGWITAENVSDFFDENGNWINGESGDTGETGESLGEGAGRVRGHDEVDGEGLNGDGGVEDGVNGGSSSPKRPRTD